MILPASAFPVGGGNVPILDIVGNATVAYSSARRLRTGVTSPYQARKSPSGADQSLVAAFDSVGNVDTAPLTTWVGANTYIGINQWYDQSGNNNTANIISSNDVGTMPKIYSNVGGFFYLNGRVVALFSAAQTQQLVMASAITLASEYTIFCVQQKISGFGALISRADNEGANSHAGLSVWNDGNTYIQDSTGYGTAVNAGTSLQVLAGSHLGGVRSIRVNGTALTTTNTVQARNGLVNRIGRQRSGGTQCYSDAYIPEIIIYNRSMTTDEIITVESNMRAYYGV